jgi:hypothetical protein
MADQREKPILFSGPMVRAILDGRKTQTRRIVKPQPIVEANGSWRWEGRHGGFVGSMGTDVDKGFPESARHWARYQPGDRLWVRETWKPVHSADPSRGARYRADVDRDQTVWRPSIHMPRWASRITLEVTGVKVERLQDISEADARDEGVSRTEAGFWNADPKRLQLAGCDARGGFYCLWSDINGPGSWRANPWVVAIAFKRIAPTAESS